MGVPNCKTMLSQELRKYKETLLDVSKKINKKYDYQFTLNLSEGFTVTSRCRSVESVEHNQDSSLGIIIYCDNRLGAAATNNLSIESINRVIEKAQNISNNTQSDECNGLPEGNFVKDNNMPQIDLHYPSNMKVNQIIELTQECEKYAFDNDRRIKNSEGSSFSYSNDSALILNSKGAYGTMQGTMYSLSCTVLAEENKNKERDYWYSVTRDFKKLDSAEKIGRQAAIKAVARLGARSIKTRVCPVLFSPEMSVSIFYDFISAIKGSSIYRRSSFLLDEINKLVFSDFISIKEEPHLANGIGSMPFDGEGMITKTKDIVKDGILKTYLLDTYSAKKLNSISTSNKGIITNIIVDSKNEKKSNMISTIEDGIYITEMMGSGVNILTGDYSRGAFGYLIKNGEIQHPVNGITVASNLKKMFKNIIGLGNDIDKRSKIITGSVLIKDITVGGTN